MYINMDEVFECVKQKKGGTAILSLIETLKEQSTINSHGSCGKTLLHVAVETNQHDLCLLLINHGADVNIETNNNKETPLHLSMDKTVKYDISSLLVSKGADVNASSLTRRPTPLHGAVNFSGYEPIPGPGPDLIQIYQGQYQKLEILLDNGANWNITNTYDETALHVLMEGTQNDVNTQCKEFKDTICKMLNLLLRHGVSINTTSRINPLTPLYYACMNRQTFLISTLIEKGADQYEIVPMTGENLLHIAVGCCNHLSTVIEAINAFTIYGLSINSKSLYGHGILHKITHIAKLEWYQILLDMGVDFNLKDIGDRTIIFYLSEVLENADGDGNDGENEIRSLTSIIDFFILNGVDINHRDLNGMTALTEAVSRRMPRAVTVFLDKGADVNITDNCNRSCLHHLILALNETLFSVQNDVVSRLAMLNIFQCHEIDFSIEDVFGKSAFDYIDFILETEEREDILRWMYSNNIQYTENNTLKRMHSAQKQLTHYLFHETNVEEEGGGNEMKCRTIGNGFSPETLMEIFQTEGIGTVSESSNPYQTVKKKVDLLVNNICKELSSLHSILTITPRISGSVSEGTKVGKPDEFDFLLFIEELEDEFVPMYRHNTLPGYAHLKLNDGCTSNKFQQFIDRDGFFDGLKFLVFFHEAILKVISLSCIWKNTELYSTFFIRNKTVKQLPANFLIDICSPDVALGSIAVTIDLVPAIRLPEFWKPNKFRKSRILYDKNNRFCATLSKFDADDNTMVRVSFSLFETQLINALQPLQKNAYTLLKLCLSHYIFVDDDGDPIQVSGLVSTYMLKTALLYHSYTAADVTEDPVNDQILNYSFFDKALSLERSRNQDIQQKPIYQLAVLILRRMQSWVENRTLPSFFIEDLNLNSTYLEFTKMICIHVLIDKLKF